MCRQLTKHFFGSHFICIICIPFTMKAALIHPHTSDPTAPYPSATILTGCLRSRAVGVFPINANVKAHGHVIKRR